MVRNTLPLAALLLTVAAGCATVREKREVAARVVRHEERIEKTASDRLALGSQVEEDDLVLRVDRYTPCDAVAIEHVERRALVVREEPLKKNEYATTTMEFVAAGVFLAPIGAYVVRNEPSNDAALLGATFGVVGTGALVLGIIDAVRLRDSKEDLGIEAREVGRQPGKCDRSPAARTTLRFALVDEEEAVETNDDGVARISLRPIPTPTLLRGGELPLTITADGRPFELVLTADELAPLRRGRGRRHVAEATRSAERNEPDEADAAVALAEALGADASKVRTLIEATPKRIEQRERAEAERLEQLARAEAERKAKEVQQARLAAEGLRRGFALLAKGKFEEADGEAMSAGANGASGEQVAKLRQAVAASEWRARGAGMGLEATMSFVKARSTFAPAAARTKLRRLMDEDEKLQARRALPSIVDASLEWGMTEANVIGAMGLRGCVGFVREGGRKVTCPSNENDVEGFDFYFCASKASKRLCAIKVVGPQWGPLLQSTFAALTRRFGEPTCIAGCLWGAGAGKGGAVSGTEEELSRRMRSDVWSVTFFMPGGEGNRAARMMRVEQK